MEAQPQKLRTGSLGCCITHHSVRGMLIKQTLRTGQPRSGTFLSVSEAVLVAWAALSAYHGYADLCA